MPINVINLDLIVFYLRSDNVEKAKKLLRKFDVNYQFANGSSFIAESILNGSKKCLEYLLSHGDINVNKYGKDEKTTLEKLVEGMFMKLLESKGGLQIQERHAKRMECVKLFLEDGRLYVNEEDFVGETVLHNTIGVCNSMWIDIDEYDVLINRLNQDFLTFFVQKLLLHPLIEVNRKNRKGNTALHLAIRAHQYEMMMALIKHKDIDLNAVALNFDSSLSLSVGLLHQVTPLHVAVWLENRKAVRELVAQPGCKVNSLNLIGGTPMHLSVYFRQKETLEILLKTPMNGLFEMSNGFLGMAISSILCSEYCVKRLPISLWLFIFSFWRITGQYQMDAKGRLPVDYLKIKGVFGLWDESDEFKCRMLLGAGDEVGE